MRIHGCVSRHIKDPEKATFTRPCITDEAEAVLHHDEKLQMSSTDGSTSGRRTDLSSRDP